MMATSQTIENGPPGGSERSSRIFYGWWIVVAAFLNLFFSVGVIFYGFPVFYPAFTAGLGFARGQVTQGFLLGFLFLGLPCGVLTGRIHRPLRSTPGYSLRNRPHRLSTDSDGPDAQALAL